MASKKKIEIQQENENLKNLIKEYSLEIKSTEITLDDLLEVGIESEALLEEAALRKIYGDGSLHDMKTVESETGEAKVQKIEESDITNSKALKNQFDLIERDPFNSNVDEVSAKVR